jgi:uncharacterized protein (TIGR03437 family)
MNGRGITAFAVQVVLAFAFSAICFGQTPAEAVITNVAVPQCDSPHPSVSNFLPTDSQAVTFFRFITPPNGSMSINWVGPGTNITHIWTNINQSSCFSDLLPIAGTNTAKLVGDWSAQVTLNGIVIVNIPFHILPIPIEAVMTNVAVSQCDSPHPSITNFLATDPQALLYFRFAAPPPSGSLTLIWAGPGGTLLNGGNWNNLNINQYTCFTSILPIAGTNVASLIGDWSGQVMLNGTKIVTVPFHIGPAASIVTLRSTPNPSNYGQTLTLTASVTPSTATGTVTFKDVLITVGTANLTGGTATVTTSILAAGQHSLTAVYNGDAYNSPGTSAVVTQTINRAPTTTSLTSSPNPSAPGQSVTLTATVTPLGAAGVVTFKDGSTTLGTGTLSGGTATLAVNTLTAGTHALTAAYGGNTNYDVSTSAVRNQMVNGIIPVSFCSPNFRYVMGSAAPQSIICQFASPAATSFTASTTTPWLQVSPASGVFGASPVTIFLTANVSGLAAGSYTGSFSIGSSQLGTVTIPVHLTVTAIPTGQLITTIAGGGWRAFPSSRTAAAGAPLGSPEDVAVDGQGNVYISDTFNNIVVRMSPAGTLDLVAGNGRAAFAGDGGPATSASLNHPLGIALDSAGNLYIADQNNQRIRKVSGGTITTVAGNGRESYSGDGGPATSAALAGPYSVAVDAVGNLYIADSENNSVRKVAGGFISTVAGTGVAGYTGDGGAAANAMLFYPVHVALDTAGNLYIADSGNFVVRKVSGGTITTVAGNGSPGIAGDGGPATSANFSQIYGLAVDASGQLFIADAGASYVRKVSGGVITSVAGNGGLLFSGDGGLATSAALNGPSGVAVDASGQVFIADYFNERVRKVSSGIITTVAGGGIGTLFGDGAAATSAGVFNALDIALDPSGNLYIADSANNSIRKVSGGVITTVAGTGQVGYSGDRGAAARATLNYPEGLAADSAGNLYIADTFNHAIRKVSGGIITTLAGTGAKGFSGDSGPATSASLSYPDGVAVDAAGNVYIADTVNNRIRKVSGGVITTVAGGNTAGFSGDGGQATSALLNGPRRIAIDSAGNLYFTDRGNGRIRKVSGGIITTVAGNGSDDFYGDGGPAINAAFSNLNGLAVDAGGNLYIADAGNGSIRKVAGGNVSTVAGDGSDDFYGDGGPAINAAFSGPNGVAVDGKGNVYIADTFNNRIREILTSLPSYQTSPSSLTFSVNAAGNLAAAQSITLSSAVASLAFTASASAGWLSVTPASGSLPTSLQVNVDSSSLGPGTYNASVTIAVPNASPATVTVPVSLTVPPPVPAQLSVGTQSFNFTAVQGSAPQTGTIQVQNGGGGSLNFSSVSATASGGSWLSISPANGSATAASPATITLTAAPGTLAPGTYQGTVTISSGDSTATVDVTLSIAASNPRMLLSQAGLNFIAMADGGAPLPQTFGVLNIGDGSMDWSATATTLAGGNWLQISPTSGTVVQPYLDVSQVNVNIDPTGLAPDEYYGRIQVSSRAVNSPQLITVILKVLPAGQSPGPEVRPASLIFTGVAGSTPGSQDVMLGNPRSQPDSFYSGQIGVGFTHLPASADVPPNQPSTLRVFPDFSQLDAGSVVHGVVNLLFSDGTARDVTVLTVVAPSATASSRLGPLASGSCGTLNLQWRTPAPPTFSIVQGRGQTLELQLVDNCGNLIGPSNPKSASVQASFSNKDPDVSLVHVGNGIWTGTWKPVNPSSGPVTVSVTAFNSTGQVLQSGQSNPLFGTILSGNTPLVTAGGVQHAASYVLGRPIAPGTLITLKGLNLANSESQASGQPLPTVLNGTQVFLGAEALPLLYSASGQVNVQVPYDVPVNTQFQVTVQRDNVQSLPEQLVIAPAQPGIFSADASGLGQGVIYKSDGITLAQPGTPAAAGESISIFCTGLGVVTPDVPAGTTPPASPISSTVNPVTVTIGGQDGQATVGTLVPGQPGVYQVTAIVPNGVSGDAVPVIVTVAGQSSPATVTMAVQ